MRTSFSESMIDDEEYDSNSRFDNGSEKLLGRSRPAVSLMAVGLEHMRTKVRLYTVVACSVVILILLSLVVQYDNVHEAVLKQASQASTQITSPINAPQTRDKNLHILIPTNKQEVNLCKTLLGLTLLGYPTPTLVAWEQEFTEGGKLGGGSHVAKVSQVLKYLEDLPAEQDNDLVFMIDAYDIWFQLPYSTLVDRYHSVTDAAQTRLVQTLGSETVADNQLLQLIIFGSGKRCAPNELHMVACYAVPESPLPEDLYGNNTDTVMGPNEWRSNRQRFLNSGFIIGPAGAMRKMFAEAWKLIKTNPDHNPNDNGSGVSDYMYHGSDQSIFADMFGRQEWAREKLRVDKAGPSGTPRSSRLQGAKVDNVLEPSFVHEHFAPDLTDGNPFEFGIHLDYWSDLGHQTVNSEEDGHWIVYEGDKPRSQYCGTRSAWDCPLHIPESPPIDVVNATLPNAIGGLAWGQQRLYTHVCLSRIPIMVHHNGRKDLREKSWPQMWYQPNARAMLNDLARTMNGSVPKDSLAEHQRAPRVESIGGAWTDTDKFLRWDELCPSTWDEEIYRDR